MSIPFKVDFLGKKTPAWLCVLNNSLWNILDGKNFVTEYIPEGNKWILQTVKLSNELEQEVTTLLKNAIPQNITVEYDPFPLDYTRLAYLESTNSTANYMPVDYIPTASSGFMTNFVTLTQDFYQHVFSATSPADNVGNALSAIYTPHYNGFYPIFAAKKMADGTVWRTDDWTGDIINKRVTATFNWLEDKKATVSSFGERIMPDGLRVTDLSSMSLFGLWNTRGVQYLRGRIFSAAISERQKIVAKFVPVVDVNGQACMYDLIRGRSFYGALETDFIAGVETLAQLYALLAKLPDLTGQTQGTLTIRLDASLQTDELRALIDERGEAKNWEINEAPEIEIAS